MTNDAANHRLALIVVPGLENDPEKKGARDEHRVSVADDFWPLFARYMREARGLGEPH